MTQRVFIVNGERIAIEGLTRKAGEVCFVLNGKTYRFCGDVASGQVRLHDGHAMRGGFVGGRNAKGAHPVMLHGGFEAWVQPVLPGRKASGEIGKTKPHTAPMPGVVQKVFVAVGEHVEAGQKLLVMEAMKLQLAVEAAYAGEVKALCCQPGSLVAEGDLLVDVAAAG